MTEKLNIYIYFNLIVVQNTHIIRTIADRPSLMYDYFDMGE